MGMGAAALVYAAVTALMFRDLLPDVTTHLYVYPGDPLLNAAILAWNASHLPLTEAWWNFPSYAPLTGVTAFTEHLLLAYPIASPVIWITGNPVLAYNVVYLVAFPVNGVCAYALARELTGSPRAALVGGLAFAFAPYQAVHMTHLQMLLAFGIPLTLLGLHRAVGGGTADGAGRARRRGLLIFTVGWLCAALANAYTLVFVPVLVVLWAVWFVRPSRWRRLVAPAAAAMLVVLLLAPLLWGYHVRQSAYGLVRQHDEIRSFAADVTGIAHVFHRSSLWAGVLPATTEEGALFPGVTIAALGGLALAWSLPARRRTPAPQDRRMPPWWRRDAVAFYGIAALALWLLALGPAPEWSGAGGASITGPYRALMELPGVRSIRVPARAWLPATLCLAMLAAFGTAVALRLVQHRFGGARWHRAQAAACTAVLAVAIVAEGWFADVTVAAPRPMRPGLFPEGAIVLDMPVEESFWNAIPQYRAVMGGYRTVNGYSGYEPAHFRPLRRALADRQPHVLAAYRRTADLYVILRPGEDPRVARWVATQRGAEHLYDVENARIYRLPRLEPGWRYVVRSRSSRALPGQCASLDEAVQPNTYVRPVGGGGDERDGRAACGRSAVASSVGSVIYRPAFSSQPQVTVSSGEGLGAVRFLGDLRMLAIQPSWVAPGDGIPAGL